MESQMENTSEVLNQAGTLVHGSDIHLSFKLQLLVKCIQVYASEML